MFVVGTNLEKRVAAAAWCGSLRNEGFERNESAQNHFEESIIDPAFPIVVIFFHQGRTFGIGTEDGFLDVFEKLLADNVVLLADFYDCPLQMLVRIGCELGSVVG